MRLTNGPLAFFWAGKEEVNGGACLVAWDCITVPLRLGGFGVKDLRLQGLALDDHGDRGWGENLFLEGSLDKWANNRGFSSNGICSGSQEKKKQPYGSTSAN
jgi:hypothetical protein